MITYPQWWYRGGLVVSPHSTEPGIPSAAPAGAAPRCWQLHDTGSRSRAQRWPRVLLGAEHRGRLCIPCCGHTWLCFSLVSPLLFFFYNGCEVFLWIDLKRQPLILGNWNKKSLQTNSGGCFWTKPFHWSSKASLYFVAKGMWHFLFPWEELLFGHCAHFTAVLGLCIAMICYKALWMYLCWKPTRLIFKAAVHFLHVFVLEL